MYCKIIFQIYFESAEGSYLKSKSWQSIFGKTLHRPSLKCEKNALQQGLCALWVSRKAKYIWGMMVGVPFTEDGMWSGGNLDRRTLSLQFHTALPTGHEQHWSTTRAAAKWETMGGGWVRVKWISLIRTHIYILHSIWTTRWQAVEFDFMLTLVSQIIIRFRIEVRKLKKQKRDWKRETCLNYWPIPIT